MDTVMIWLLKTASLTEAAEWRASLTLVFFLPLETNANGLFTIS